MEKTRPWIIYAPPPSKDSIELYTFVSLVFLPAVAPSTDK